MTLGGARDGRLEPAAGQRAAERAAVLGRQPAGGVQHGAARRRAGAARRAVHLAVAEHDHLRDQLGRRRGAARQRREVGQHHAEQEAQVGAVRVVDLDAGRVDVAADVGRLADVLGGGGVLGQPDVGGAHHGVEAAAVADVQPTLGAVRQRQAQVLVQHERRHGQEARLVVGRQPGAHQAARTLQVHLGVAVGGTRHDALVHQVARHGHRGVAAHGAVAVVVDEERGGGGLRVVGRHQDDAEHVAVAARLGHQQAAVAVQPLPAVAPLLQDRVTLDRRQAGDDDTHRLAGRVHLHSTQPAAGGTLGLHRQRQQASRGSENSRSASVMAWKRCLHVILCFLMCLLNVKLSIIVPARYLSGFFVFLSTFNYLFKESHVIQSLIETRCDLWMEMCR